MVINRRMLLKALGIGLISVGCAAPTPSPSAAPPKPAAPTPAPPKPTTPAAAPPQPTAVPAKPTAQAPAAPKPLQEATLRLDWRVIGYHSVFWAAVDKGFFAEQGLNVKLFEGQGSGSTLQIVASGTQLFGFLDGGVLAQGVQRGIEARMIACMFQRNMSGILSSRNAPLAKPEDFPGKSLAASVGGASEAQWPLFAKKANIDLDKVSIVATDSAGKYAALLSGRVHGSVHQVPTDALDYERQGFPVHQLLFAEYGLDRLGHGLVALNKTIAEQPDLTRRFVAGVVKGWKYALDNVDGAAALSKKFFESNLTPDTLAGQWKVTFDFQRSNRTKGKPVGWMDPADWEDTQKLLVEVGAMQSMLPVGQYFTNEFLPPT